MLENEPEGTHADSVVLPAVAQSRTLVTRRRFAQFLGLPTVLVSPLALVACGGGDGGDDTPKEYPRSTPIADTPAQPATIGSYQRKTGYFNWAVTVDDASREIEVYIPQGARQREYWIAIALPDGVRSEEFLGNAGWFDVAHDNTVCLLILKPGSTGKWGETETESAYVSAAMGTLVSSGPHYSAFMYHYVVGYGAGAAALQLYAARTPLSMIAQAYVDASADSAYNALLSAAGNTQVGPTLQPNHMDFRGNLDINNNPVTQQRTFAAQYFRDVPIPTWFVGKTSASLLSYWAGVNDTELVATVDAQFGQVYWQNKDISNAVATASSAVRSQTAVQAGAAELASPQLARNIYRFLTQYSGYDNNSVYGHFITSRLDYKKAIASRNMVYRDHMWSGSTTQQTYIVYVPESVKKNYSLTKPAPVVFATHGAGQTAFVFFEATDIKEAAERHGFVAVTYDTTTTPYLADLVPLVKQDCQSLGVAADPTRLYVYGHSAGGGATTGFARDDGLVATFAAFGITSGVFPAPAATASNKLVPVYALYGEYDYWPMKFGPLVAGDFRGSQNSQYALSANVQNYWLGRLIGRSLTDELTSPTYTLTDGIGASLVPQNTSINLLVRPTPTVNRYRIYTWRSNGVPLFVWGQTYGRGHNMIPSDLHKIWEDWFSKWQRGTDADTLLYWQDGVGVGQPVALAQAAA
jgi:hypothetical protein